MELLKHEDFSVPIKGQAVNLLHVEDDLVDASLMQHNLTNDHTHQNTYTLDLATNLDEALTKLEVNQYAAILLDLKLPDGDGVNNVQMLKDICPDVPVIVVTGMDDPELVAKALQNGAQEYLLKDDVNPGNVHRSIQSSIYRKKIESELAYQAFHDSLTGLLNRNAFEATARRLMQKAHRWKRQEAMAFIDLNKFKQINDTYGHEVGNKMIAAVGARVQKAFRKSDIVARYAGDEFVVYLDSGDDPVTMETCVYLAEKVIKIVEAPVVIDKIRHKISLSIGFSIMKDGQTDFDTMLRNADEAMYMAKNDPAQKYWII